MEKIANFIDESYQKSEQSLMGKLNPGIKIDKPAVSGLVLKPIDDLADNTSTVLPVASADAIFKQKINDDLYKYYPLSVGASWTYESWTYGTEKYQDENIYVKKSSVLTISVNKIFEDKGKEYVIFDKHEELVAWQRVEEPRDPADRRIKVYEKILIPKDEKKIIDSEEALEISGLSLKYITPNYPSYIDTFPLQTGVLADLNSKRSRHYQSTYGFEALLWNREVFGSFEIKGQLKYNNCYRSFIYDLKGSAGSKDEIVFCEGLGPVKYTRELKNYPQYSVYQELVDFEAN